MDRVSRRTLKLPAFCSARFIRSTTLIVRAPYGFGPSSAAVLGSSLAFGCCKPAGSGCEKARVRACEKVCVRCEEGRAAHLIVAELLSHGNNVRLLGSSGIILQAGKPAAHRSWLFGRLHRARACNKHATASFVWRVGVNGTPFATQPYPRVPLLPESWPPLASPGARQPFGVLIENLGGDRTCDSQKISSHLFCFCLRYPRISPSKAIMLALLAGANAFVAPSTSVMSQSRIQAPAVRMSERRHR